MEEVEGADIHCTVLIGGELSDRKSMSFPGKVLQGVLEQQDKSDLAFGIENGVDYVACSFVPASRICWMSASLCRRTAVPILI